MSTEAKRTRLAELLSQHQQRSGLSGRALARKIGVNSASLSNYLNSASYPSPDVRAKIARAIAMTPNELESYLDNIPLQPLASLEQIVQDIRAMDSEDFAIVVKVVFERIQEELEH